MDAVGPGNEQSSGSWGGWETSRLATENQHKPCDTHGKIFTKLCNICHHSQQLLPLIFAMHTPILNALYNAAMESVTPLPLWPQWCCWFPSEANPLISYIHLNCHLTAHLLALLHPFKPDHISYVYLSPTACLLPWSCPLKPNCSSTTSMIPPCLFKHNCSSSTSTISIQAWMLQFELGCLSPTLKVSNWAQMLVFNPLCVDSSLVTCLSSLPSWIEPKHLLLAFIISIQAWFTYHCLLVVLLVWAVFYFRDCKQLGPVVVLWKVWWSLMKSGEIQQSHSRWPKKM